MEVSPSASCSRPAAVTNSRPQRPPATGAATAATCPSRRPAAPRSRRVLRPVPRSRRQIPHGTGTDCGDFTSAYHTTECPSALVHRPPAVVPRVQSDLNGGSASAATYSQRCSRWPWGYGLSADIRCCWSFRRRWATARAVMLPASTATTQWCSWPRLPRHETYTAFESCRNCSGDQASPSRNSQVSTDEIRHLR